MRPQAEIPQLSHIEGGLSSLPCPEVVPVPLRISIPGPSVCSGLCPRVDGKFLWVGGEKLYVRGVTYGTFRPDGDGVPYPRPEVVEEDFAQMAANGANCVRTYTLPPRWLLDLAEQAGLYVMAGLWGEQYILHEKKLARSTEEHIREGIRACQGHPAVLCYALANEIPASAVRWYGVRRVERFLRRLYETAKEADPKGLVTYVNYPMTEYLELPFLDLMCFNLYLETRKPWEAYLARLQNLAGGRPLLLSETGLDSRRNGEFTQAQTLDWQVRLAFSAGCAGVFVYAWTDEWHCGGADIHDWDFGLTRRDRQPKPALGAVRHAFDEVPFSRDLTWPRISVIVCTYNGQRTIRECLEGLLRLRYPDYEVIVVNDGSKDKTAAIVREYDVRRISTENRGLSAARNVGLSAATGEIVAYIDDDACPDPDWLLYLASAFRNSDYAAIGGPNIPFPNDGFVANCVAHAPGGPTHILISDTEAEHIPGCNMAFRRSCLEAVGGFDPQFRIAGDDVDLCWRLQKRGWKLGLAHSATVWHHCRSSVKTYLKQQWNYGVAEALLQKKWPEKYSASGHPMWCGRIYSPGLTRGLNSLRSRIHYGVWGSASFQRLYEPAPSSFESFLLMPEFNLVISAVAALTVLGVSLWFALPLLGLLLGLLLFQAIRSACGAKFATPPKSRWDRLKLRTLVASLHLLQPLARLGGRLRRGLTPIQIGRLSLWTFPRTRTAAIWSEKWKPSLTWIEVFKSALTAEGPQPVCGGPTDDWDFEVLTGLLASARAVMAVEEYGRGRQFVRFRISPRWRRAFPAIFVPALAAAIAVREAAWLAGALFGASALGLAALACCQCGIAVGKIVHALKSLEKRGA
jgi:cellulose synthase/poly-beta-1,6-N-acetylglucosamine synthase-like glycosyltransferase